MTYLLADQDWDRLRQDFTQLGDLGQLALVAVRLLIAAILGGLLGYQREKLSKPAGLRTHMLVALGAAFFVIAPQLEGIDVSRVIQGVAAGIGFLCGGVILKMEDKHRIEGLTTATSIWLTTAIGLAVGIGRIGIALMCTVLAFVILDVVQRLHVEEAIHRQHPHDNTGEPRA